ncbi:hemoglobin [Bradyrhizobium sp. SSBR45G]|uniref:globin family protein n=1 Tax=unclassified Bradyrhizobium TaxID=2631580 RepID=UPI0023428E52|nr:MULTISPECIES: globin family protein [unclassified Bradyrhizobium]GLH81549.1 hemoglobin [Bradyrhizobium sp. SSBR45G]GLH89044.1 hemoglobin [Bradyrhizobium sp. SSBR45R]
MLTSEEIGHVRSSFDMVFANATDMTTTFYDRIFELAPECRSMFRDDIDVLKRDFIATLAVLVGSLDQMTGLLSSSDILGRNHARYGVRPEHYPVVCEALMWSLAKGLGPHWTDEVEQAWRKVYGVIAQRMIAISAGHPRS